MKTPHSLALILSMLALPLAAHAAKGTAKVASLKGSVQLVDAAKKTPIAEGQTIAEGSVVETGADATASIALPGNGKMVLGPNSRVRISSFEQADNAAFYSLEVILTRGTLTADAGQGSASSNFVIRTTTGSVRAPGCAFQMEYAPAGAVGGTLSVSSVSGIPNVSPTGALTQVPVMPGNTVILTSNNGTSNQPQITPTSTPKAAQIEKILGSKVASNGEPITAVSPALSPSVAPQTRFDGSTIISPNGNF